jgi:hypothetical protein
MDYGVRLKQPARKQGEHQMAFPTAVNSQITDSISQANLKVIGDAPAMGMGNLYIATSQALSNAAHNSTNNQQQTTLTSQAVNAHGVSTLYSVDTASGGVATGLIYGLHVPSNGQV